MLHDLPPACFSEFVYLKFEISNLSARFSTLKEKIQKFLLVTHDLLLNIDDVLFKLLLDLDDVFFKLLLDRDDIVFDYPDVLRELLLG